MTPETAQTNTSAIDRARALIESRLEELDRERDQLRDALAHLDGSPARRRRGPGRPRGPSGKRAGRGQRQAEFLSRLEASPGASVPELAREMGVQPQQLYAIARRLIASGTIVKRDGTYTVTSAEQPADQA